jgi:hypothetical protein
VGTGLVISTYTNSKKTKLFSNYFDAKIYFQTTTNTSLTGNDWKSYIWIYVGLALAAAFTQFAMTTNLYMFAAKASEVISKKVGHESCSSFSMTKT